MEDHGLQRGACVDKGLWSNCVEVCRSYTTRACYPKKYEDTEDEIGSTLMDSYEANK